MKNNDDKLFTIMLSSIIMLVVTAQVILGIFALITLPSWQSLIEVSFIYYPLIVICWIFTIGSSMLWLFLIIIFIRTIILNKPLPTYYED